MRENRLRSIWKSGGAAVNGWLAIPNGFAAETMAHQGWDTLTIDLQHGVIDYAAMVTMLQAISTTSDRARRAGAVARARHPDEDARRRRLRRHLPDGQHARGRAEARGVHALRAARHAQLRSGPRAALWRRGLLRARERRHRHVRDDRDRAGAGQSRLPSSRSKGSTPSTSGHRTCRSRSAASRPSTSSSRRPRRRWSTSWRARRRMGSSPASTTEARRPRAGASPRASSSSPSDPMRACSPRDRRRSCGRCARPDSRAPQRGPCSAARQASPGGQQNRSAGREQEPTALLETFDGSRDPQPEGFLGRAAVRRCGRGCGRHRA